MKKLLVPTLHMKQLALAYSMHNKKHGENNRQRLWNQAIEECNELALALSHERRGKSELEDILEEYIDIIICLNMILEKEGVKHFNINKKFKQKINKLMKNLSK